MNVGDYGLYFGLTLVLSTLFAMGGVGSAIALVPSFSMLGLAIDFAKALGLFVNMASTVTASVMNFRRGVLDIGFALPLVLTVLVATPIGAWSSHYVPIATIRWLLIAFLVAAAFLLLFSRRTVLVARPPRWPLYAIGGSVGIISGMLGVGGGTLMMPALILLGYDAKKAARAISFVIPFSSAGAFLTYLTFTTIELAAAGRGGSRGDLRRLPRRADHAQPTRGCAGQEAHRGAPAAAGRQDDLVARVALSTKRPVACSGPRRVAPCRASWDMSRSAIAGRPSTRLVTV